LGYVSDAKLSELYAGATALAACSLYEGFCLPVAEAAACWCPSIVTRGTAQQEIAGEGGYAVNAADGRSMAEALRTLSRDKSLRSDLANAAAARAPLFDWDEAAAKYRSLYDFAN
jgi:glycosyltransferase involved in cell wall biosynthesis